MSPSNAVIVLLWPLAHLRQWNISPDCLAKYVYPVTDVYVCLIVGSVQYIKRGISENKNDFVCYLYSMSMDNLKMAIHSTKFYSDISLYMQGRIQGGGGGVGVGRCVLILLRPRWRGGGAIRNPNKIQVLTFIVASGKPRKRGGGGGGCNSKKWAPCNLKTWIRHWHEMKWWCFRPLLCTLFRLNWANPPLTCILLVIFRTIDVTYMLSYNKYVI